MNKDNGIIYLKICDNCESFDREKEHCTIRNTIKKGVRYPLKRKCYNRACEVFLFK